MLQKIGSWFGEGWDGLLHWTGIKERWQQLINDHPRLGGGIVISSVIIALLFGLYGLALTPVRLFDRETKVFEIRYGTTQKEVGRLLKSQGMIRSRTVFDLYIRMNPRQHMVKSGHYKIGPGMSLPAIIAILHSGTPGQIRITIPEGMTANEIASLLEQKGLANAAQFEAKMKDPDLIKQLLGEQVTTTLEGFLFPDTYYFDTDASLDQIITMMVKHFQSIFTAHFGQLPPTKIHEIVIMASLVEKEARKAEERPIIAGVFYNRLRMNFALQSCATIEYALGHHKEQLTYHDLEIRSPYNTYKNNGLPPGPIANPGLASLQAAAAPAKVSYLYFVAKPDGGHAFSNTFTEHLRAQRLYQGSH